MTTLRDKVFSATDIETETVEVPEWDATFEVRGLTVRSRTELFKRVSVDGDVDETDINKMYPEIVIATTYDPATGERVFSDGDQETLLERSAAAIDKLANAALRVSGLAAESIDEAGKDSAPTLESVTSSS